MPVVSLKSYEIKFILDGMLQKNISTPLDYNTAETIVKKLIKQLDDEILANNYSDNFYEVNKQWRIND